VIIAKQVVSSPHPLLYIKELCNGEMKSLKFQVPIATICQALTYYMNVYIGGHERAVFRFSVSCLLCEY
jgi:hypothetical protein